MMTVVQIYRKRNPAFFSIEKVFALLNPWLEKKARLVSIELPHYTTGPGAVVKNLLSLRKKTPADVYHITGDVHYAVLAVPAGRCILTIHDCVFLYAASGVKRKFLKWLLLDMPVRRAAVVTTISEFSRQEIIRYSKCAPEKVMVIPNSLNEAVYYRQQQFNAAKPVILFIGTTPNKNLQRVAPALEGIHCSLKIIGRLSPADIDLLEAHRVDFTATANLSEHELAEAYAGCDIVLFPSTFEGFGLPIIEGQKAGRVVITSNIEPMKTVAGEGAYLVDPYDVADIRKGVEETIANAGLRASLIKKGFDNTTRYEASHVADQYYRLYEAVAAGSPIKKIV